MDMASLVTRLSLLVRLLAVIGVITTAQVASARSHHHHHHRFHLGAGTSGGAGEDYYTAVSGHRVDRAVHAGSAPSGATARCGDNSWSFSESHRGTCSHHGGVTRWL